MFWTGFAIGIFLGATVGMVVAGLLAAGATEDVEERLSRFPAEMAVMDEAKPAPDRASKAPRPAAFLDEYPYS
ncbi:MAG: hypothetical protein MUD16_17805 [Desulfobacterales bacterium]|jgi:hypothetical protein|nr:hypothetical protein [Desulfobacterales bacterium]